MKFARVSAAALLASLLMVSCRNPEPVGESWRRGTAGDAAEDAAKDKALADAFRAKYAKWMVSAVPEFDRVERTRVEKRMILKRTGKVQLDLNLGDRWSLGRQYNPSRTESRYRLTDIKGRVLASAESMLAVQDLSPRVDGQFIHVFHDPVTGGFLIAEEQCWTAFRYIVFRPGTEREGWTVNYCACPDREAWPYRVNRTASFLGFYNGAIYFRCDGQAYAMPVDEAEQEDDLGYSIG